MKRLILAVVALTLSLPAMAQGRFFDVTGSAVWVDPTGSGSLEDLADPAEIQFDSSLGYGASVNFFVTDRISIDIGASKTTPETQLQRQRVVGVTTGEVDMVPITGIVQFHLAPNGTFDPYIGGGAAYVLFGDVNGVNDVQRIDLEDDAGFVVNAGLGIKLGSRFGIVLDGKYVPIESNAKAVVLGTTTDTDTKIDVSPIILSAGLQLRF